MKIAFLLLLIPFLKLDPMGIFPPTGPRWTAPQVKKQTALPAFPSESEYVLIDKSDPKLTEKLEEICYSSESDYSQIQSLLTQKANPNGSTLTKSPLEYATEHCHETDIYNARIPETDGCKRRAMFIISQLLSNNAEVTPQCFFNAAVNGNQEVLTNLEAGLYHFNWKDITDCKEQNIFHHSANSTKASLGFTMRLFEKADDRHLYKKDKSGKTPLDLLKVNPDVDKQAIADKYQPRRRASSLSDIAVEELESLKRSLQDFIGSPTPRMDGLFGTPPKS